MLNSSGNSKKHLVKQNVSLALHVARFGYVLHVGKVLLESEIDELKDSEIVKKAYLGG